MHIYVTIITERQDITLAKATIQESNSNLNTFQEIVEFQKNSSLRIWYNDCSDCYAPHWHTVLEIILPLENYYLADINEHHFRIMPGEILLIPPGELHELTAPNTGKRLIFMFDISMFSKLKSFAGIQSLLVQPIYITLDDYPSIYDDVYSLLMNIQEEYFGANEYAELTIYSLLINLFVKLGYHHIHKQDLFPNVSLSKQKEYVRKFNQLLTYIDQHYMEELDLDHLSESVGFSKYHFLRLFKQYMGTTLGDYVTIRRIKASEKLLCNLDLSIAEVASQSGFSSISTFNRIFKQYKKCSPTEYRQHNTSLKFLR